MFLFKLKTWNYVLDDLGFGPFSLEIILYSYVMFYFVNLLTFNLSSEKK